MDRISGKIQLGAQDCTSRAFQPDDKAFRINKISGTGLTNLSLWLELAISLSVPDTLRVVGAATQAIYSSHCS
jgi:hypothetical protein